MALSPGTSLGPYRIEGPLGAGGMGEVYRARDTRLDRTVAVKVLPGHVASDSNLRQRFEREARTVAALNHPHICTLYDIGREGETDFLVMEYLDGETLETRLARGALPPTELLRIGREIAEGVEAAHRAGLVHRDLKPANVMLTRAGTKVLDFGVAKDVKAPSWRGADDAATEAPGLTRAGVLVGTLPYMAPEQLEGKQTDVRTDIWALGCLLYEMATAERPFRADTEAGLITAIMSGRPVPPTRPNPLLPSRLDRVTQRCLQKDPERRWQSSRDVAIELEELERDDASVSAPHVDDSRTPAGRQPETVVDAAIQADRPIRWRLWTRAAVLVPIVALAGGLVFQQRRLSQERQRVERVDWARQEALPQVIRHIEAREYADAFALASDAEAVIPDDVVLRGLWSEMSNRISIETDPSGADVFLRPNAGGRPEWQPIGASPIANRRLPLGAFRLRVEKNGFETREVLLSLSYPQTDGSFKPLPSFSTPEVRNHISLRLDPAGAVPPGMIAVDGGQHLAALSGFPLEPVTLSPYFIDRTEVTNAAFKEFVDASGYEKREYWQQAFRQGDRVLDWKQAMALFVDTTGRPGPAGWELGRYASGHEDDPVGGVSWFEAAAYAAFRGKELPTVYHWIRAALPSGEHTLSMAPEIVPMSNFGGTGPARVGSFPGIGVSGAVDLAGNLREWCWNESRGGRVALGGAWSDPAYAFTSPARPSAFDRSLVNGFRLMLERDERSGDALRSPVAPPGIDVYTVKAISDEAFARNKGYFAYSNTPLNPVVGPAGESAPDWRRESVSIDAAYGNERFTVHLDLPTTGNPPYRAVVYFPGTNATEQSTFQDAYWERFDYIPRSGRALVRPVLAGMYERSDRPVTPPHRSQLDQARAYVQDLGRTIDYLETRGDIDVSGLAYMGLSLGAFWGPVALAYEDRFRVAIFISGGLTGVGAASTAPRVTVPFLLLGGRYDYMVPVDTNQKALFDLLGTPAELKRRVIFEAGHLPLPRADVIRETLEWLHRYQGQVAR